MIKYVLFSFWIVLIYPLGVDLHLTGIPLIAADLQATESQLHMAFSIYLAGMASTMLIAGWCADHIGRKPVVLVGAMIFAASSIMAGTSTTANFFLIARFLQGIGAGFCYVVTFAILRDVLSARVRTKVLAMMNGITCIAPVLAPVIGFAILLFYHWSVMFYFMAAYAVVSILFCLIGIKETKPVINKNQHNDTLATSATEERFLNSFFLTRLIISCFGIAVILTYVNVSPIILMGNLGFTTGQFSTAMTLLAMLSMATSFSMPKLISLFKSQSLIYTALSLFLVNALILLSYLSGIEHIALLFVVFGFCGVGFSMLFGIIMSQALSPYSRKAGIASSILGISQLSFASLYIWIMGWIGVQSMHMLLIILLAAGLISMILLRISAQSSLKTATIESI
ncbi:MdtL family multidrug efflux MFS transporter [Providencia vermicola]|uniref:MdtL family multidrug efflux MFS transporter n=1 Tax=Providencia vermicola TaxID=333965 RepID=A0AAX3RVZ4_9GAMM|nr:MULTISPECIES: MdtL family multidrug efflux MFS transporter [Providencia]ELR5122784.1 MdtL family multidrug efflux MFS transporter [Providencia stuartii]ELX8380711.1 MdtL family multidrug efflux MFS transporter [Providencia stuartii]ELX8381387.1 MdtL family multidrug efflux MFS transporter [Providencia stuartii]EMD5260248.1 MdtL family multidrug efflux MFS transporter [Providencia stuartii]USB37888.1 MdtL family multidrug efflux MFS transporter [Providencia vermicola]